MRRPATASRIAAVSPASASRALDFRKRERADDVGAERDVERDPAVQPCDDRRRRRQREREAGGHEREPQEHRHRRLGQRVRGNTEQRQVPELQPEDRRRDESAARRHRDPEPKTARERTAREAAVDRRHDREDRRHGRERELEARVVDQVGVPRKQSGRRQQERIPGVAQPAAQPRERRERARDPCPNHRRLWADREHVSHDPGERPDLADPAREAEEPGEDEGPGRHQDDVLPAHGEEVVEARGPEVVAQLRREARSLAQDDAFQDGAPLTGQPGCDRTGEPAPEPIGDAAEASARGDLTPLVEVQNDVHALTTQTGPLVEAVLGARRCLDDGERVEDRPLRRRLGRREARARPARRPARRRSVARDREP